MSAANLVIISSMFRGFFVGLLVIVSAVAVLAEENSIVAPETARPASSTAPPGTARDGQHDFDWEFGKWHTHL